MEQKKKRESNKEEIGVTETERKKGNDEEIRRKTESDEEICKYQTSL